VGEVVVVVAVVVVVVVVVVAVVFERTKFGNKRTADSRTRQST
jgi:hypothetical protein